MPSKRLEPESKPQSTFLTRTRIVVFAMVGTALLVFFLPTIMLRGPWRDHVINYALSDLHGSVEIAQISCGWFNPLQIKGLQIRDLDDNPVVTIASVQTTRSIAGFLLSSDYGTVEVDDAALDLQLRNDGSNLEDVFAAYLVADNENSSAIPRIEIQISNGVVRLGTSFLENQPVLEKIKGLVRCNQQDDIPVAAEIEFHTLAAGQSTGTVAVQLAIDPDSADTQSSTVRGEVAADNCRLAVLAPVLTRLIGPTNCAGSLNGKFRFDADAGNSAFEIEIDSIDARGIALVSPRWLGDDQLSIVNLTAAGNLQVGSRIVVADRFRARSEFAQLEADGRFDIAQITQLASGKQIPHSTFQLDASLDLPQVVRMLPGTMRLRDDVRMESGQMRIQANAQDDHGQPRLIMNAEATNMNFSVGDRNVRWHRPVRLVGIASRQQQKLRFEELQLQSEFLSLSGQAGLEDGHLQISADLEKATRQLGQVVDLAGLQMAGRVDGDLQWNARPIDAPVARADSSLPIGLKARFEVLDPEFVYPGRQRWQREQLAVALAADAVIGPAGDTSVDQARIEMQIGNESALAVLAEPVQNVFNSRKLQFNCQATGSLANWLDHARNLIDLPVFVADGNLSSQCLLTLNPRTCRLNQFQFEASNFSFDGFGLQIREPQVTGKTNLKYDYRDGTMLVAKGSMATATLSAETTELLVKFEPAILMDGKIACRANLRRASEWIGGSTSREDLVFEGSVIGNLDLSSAAGGLGGDLRLKVSDLVILKPAPSPAPAGFQTVSSGAAYDEVWREPVVQISSKLNLTDNFDGVRIESLDVQSSIADLQGHGSLDQLTGAMIADLSGQSRINWTNVNQMLREYLGDMVQFEGSDWQPYTIQGPLLTSTASAPGTAWLPLPLSAVAAVDWNRAAALKVPLGASRIDVQLAQSMVQLSSRSGNGLMNQLMQLRPVIDMRQAEPVLNMGQGRLLDRWQISAADSRAWMQYMAPLMADATRAEGVVSIDLQEMRLPLLNPGNLNAAGTIEVHQLKVGPGPLTQQLFAVVNQMRALLKPGSSGQDQTVWLQIKPQQVPIVVQQGRVQHQGLEWQFKDASVYTRGSVGFDQSLDLIAEFPIQADWLGDRKELSHLTGKKISIPISGTLARPRIDPRIVSQLPGKLFQDAAIGSLNEKLNEGVGKLREKIGQKVPDELNLFGDKAAGDALQNEFENRLRGELRKSLNDLFDSDRDLP